MKGQRGKQIAITRKQQRQLKYRNTRQSRAFKFNVYVADTGFLLDTIIHTGIDSEEAFLNADAWARRKFNNVPDIHIEEVDLNAAS